MWDITRGKSMTNEELFEAIEAIILPIVNKLTELENRMILQEKLVRIFAIELVRNQIEKDNLYPFVSDEDRVITAIDRITEKQTDVGKMIIHHISNHEL